MYVMQKHFFAMKIFVLRANAKKMNNCKCKKKTKNKKNKKNIEKFKEKKKKLQQYTPGVEDTDLPSSDAPGVTLSRARLAAIRAIRRGVFVSSDCCEP